VDEMIRKADELIAKHREMINSLRQELGRRIDDRRPAPGSPRPN